MTKSVRALWVIDAEERVFEFEIKCYHCMQTIPAGTLCYSRAGKIFCGVDKSWMEHNVGRGRFRISKAPVQIQDIHPEPYHISSPQEGHVIKDMSNSKSIAKSIKNYDGSEKFWEEQ